MRGSLRKAKRKRVPPKGQHTWNIILSLGRRADGKPNQSGSRSTGPRSRLSKSGAIS